MASEFLGNFLDNPVRAKVLRLFFFNKTTIFTLAYAARRIGVPPKVLEKELKSLEVLGILKKKTTKIGPRVGSQKKKKAKAEWAYAVDANFRHYEAFAKFIHEVSPIRYDNIMSALRRTGRLATVILSGSFLGDPSRPADIIVAADNLNERRLELAVRGLEPDLGREIRYAAFTTPEFRYRLTIQDRLIRDTLDYPHLVLLDKTRLL
jgi:DNA-binding Lrp family transcriptional regulator